MGMCWRGHSHVVTHPCHPVHTPVPQCPSTPSPQHRELHGVPRACKGGVLGLAHWDPEPPVQLCFPWAQLLPISMATCGVTEMWSHSMLWSHVHICHRAPGILSHSQAQAPWCSCCCLWGCSCGARLKDRGGGAGFTRRWVMISFSGAWRAARMDDPRLQLGVGIRLAWIPSWGQSRTGAHG